MKINSLEELRPLLDKQSPERRREILAALRESRGAARVSQAVDKDEKRRGSKYGNEKVRDERAGLFDSKGEFERFCELVLLERAGTIRDLKRQVEFPVAVAGVFVCSYFADFVYFEDGREVVEDFKGFRTEIYRLKKKLVEAIYGIKIFETGKPSSRKTSPARARASKKKRRARARR